MNQSEYIEMIIKDLNIITMELIEEHNIPLYMPLEKCISSSNIEDLFSVGSIMVSYIIIYNTFH